MIISYCKNGPKPFLGNYYAERKHNYNSNFNPRNQ